MNREEFYNYILERYNISGESSRLINNILLYVESNFSDSNEQYNVLCELLDGTIGLSDKEIKSVNL